MFHPTEILTLAQFGKNDPARSSPIADVNGGAASERTPPPEPADDAASSAGRGSHWSYYIFQQGKLELRGMER